jgi:hypothetical protein
MSYYVNPHGHSCPWHPYAELFGAPNIKWCEETLCQWISEPANTWSNALYLLMSFYIFWSANKTRQKELIWFAPAMFLMGLLSLVYHLSNNYLSQILDFIGMYLFVYWLIILNMRRLNWISADNQVKIMVGMSVASTILLHVMYINFIKIQLIIAAAVLAIFITEYLCFKRRLAPIRYTNMMIGAVLMGIAQAFSLMDVNRVSWVCDPTNHWFQGHAAWHVIGAIGLTFAYKHYEQFRFSEGNFDDEEQLTFDIEDQLEV